ncbi:MAG: thioesterase family protein, partial [Myxococcota bacterium]
MPKQVSLRPPGATVSTYRYRVPFFDTDAMGVVHHANYIRYLELARIVWLDEHDVPYRDVAAAGIHYATTRVKLDYHYAARFDDSVEITVW